jgi:hypothetical protein
MYSFFLKTRKILTFLTASYILSDASFLNFHSKVKNINQKVVFIGIFVGSAKKIIQYR